MVLTSPASETIIFICCSRLCRLLYHENVSLSQRIRSVYRRTSCTYGAVLLCQILLVNTDCLHEFSSHKRLYSRSYGEIRTAVSMNLSWSICSLVIHHSARCIQLHISNCFEHIKLIHFYKSCFRYLISQLGIYTQEYVVKLTKNRPF